MDLSVVIVAYKRPELVERCLRSIQRGDHTLSVEIIVVDNYGHDETTEMIRREFPGTRVVDPHENLGFARACNLGVSLSNGTRIVLLNPDTEVRPGALEALVRFDQHHPEAGIVGGRTEHVDGTVDRTSCWGAKSLWSLTCYATGLSALFKYHPLFDPESMGRWQRDTPREVGVVSGCLLLMRREVWEQLGGFDEDYFMYAEDADLSWRARSAGYRPSITPDATLIHHMGASSSSEASRIIMRETGVATYIRKRWHGIERAAALRLLLTGTAMRLIGYTLAAVLKPSVRDTRDMWRTIWRERSAWMDGYPARKSPT